MFLVKTFVLSICTIGKWSEISLLIILFKLEFRFSKLLVKILSISVAVWWVILVALVISGKKEDVNKLNWSINNSNNDIFTIIIYYFSEFGFNYVI